MRVLGPRLVEATAGPGARMVPVQLADSAVLDVIRGGDIVDILAAPDSEPDATARVIATDAVVVLVSGPQRAPPRPTTAWCWWRCRPQRQTPSRVPRSCRR